MLLVLEITLFAFLLGLALAVARLRDLFAAAMVTGIFSLVSAGLFTLLDAVDVAFTEAAVGAGISTILFLGTLAIVDEREIRSKHPLLPVGIVTLTGAALIYGTLDMPPFGHADVPTHQYLASIYLERTPEEIGIPNVVTAVLASYRGYDTLGELVVVFTAAVGILLLLGREPGWEASAAPAAAGPRRLMRDEQVIRVVSKSFIPFVLLFALYVQFHGDYGPGGGFQAGVIFAAGLILYALVFGVDALRRVAPEGAVRFFIAAGVLLYAGVGIASLLAGQNFLDYGALDPSDPKHGQHLGILLIELGVGITVASVMTSIYYAFAARSPS